MTLVVVIIMMIIVVYSSLVANGASPRPNQEIIHRDLVSDSLPHLDGVTLKTISTKDAAEARKLKQSASLSDKLIDELLTSDLLVIATPTWNFGIPSSLKAWMILLFVPARPFHIRMMVCWD